MNYFRQLIGAKANYEPRCPAWTDREVREIARRVGAKAATARTREIVDRLHLGHAFDFGRPRLDDENRIADWIEREYLDKEDDR